MLIQQVPQPVVARGHGLATAAGCQLVVAIWPWPAKRRLWRARGEGRLVPPHPMVAIAAQRRQEGADEMALSGDVIDARTALDWGR